jgi:CHAT domain-containing protein/Tfp pilus assembly protein PilF
MPANKVESQVLPGVVVEKVERFSAAEAAGIRKGDILLRWACGKRSDAISTPFDLFLAPVEQASHGTVFIGGFRGTQKHTWVIRENYLSFDLNIWGIELRPRFAKSLLNRYHAGQAMATHGNLAGASKLWMSWAREIGEAYPPCLRLWLLYHVAQTLVDAKDRVTADAAYAEAILGSADCGPATAMQLFMPRAVNSLSYQRESGNAEKYMLLALAESKKFGNDSLVVARNLIYLGGVSDEDPVKSEGYYRDALKILSQLAPRSMELLVALNGLGMSAYSSGDLRRAESYEREVLELGKQAGPLGRDQSLQLGIALDILGLINLKRQDPATARKYLLQSLSIFTKFDLTGLTGASVIGSLGVVAWEQGDPILAEKYYRQNLRIAEKAHPISVFAAIALTNIGDRLRDRGDFTQSEHYLDRALAIYEKINSSGLYAADTLHDLGTLHLREGDLYKAEDYDRRALAIQSKLAPGSVASAISLADIAEIKRRKGQPELALQSYAEALQTLESQMANLGGTEESRSGFRGEHSNYYKQFLDLLISMHQPVEALDVLERLHARSLLETLAAARADIYHGVDPKLLEQRRGLQEALHTETNERVKLLSEKHDDQRVELIEKKIDSLLANLSQVQSQIRATSPAYAALTQPQPLSAKEVQTQLLGPDTLLLEYSLGEERSYVFAVTPDSLQAFELPKRATVEKASRRVYGLLTARNITLKGETAEQKQQRIAQAEAEYQRAAAALSRMILGPVSQLQSKRLLIVSDGALAYIPFSVLPEPRDTNAAVSTTATSSTATPLMVNHEIVNLPSASVLAVLRQQELGRKPAPKAVAVLADPVFDRHDSRLSPKLAAASFQSITQTRSARAPSFSDPLLDSPPSLGLLTRSAADVGLSRNGALRLPRLRFSRREAEEIMAVTPQGEGKEAVDFEASRATATSPELSQYRIVHFATHGLLDSVHPELSGLVFSMVDKNGRPQNGFLELQDIYNLNLPADLVVLSACETGLGKEISGEGLVGLTRGFMYAGASRVMASLWKVSDAGTAALMAEFYRAMKKNNLPPAAALRAAQIKMWQQKRWNNPYYWAAFQIQGEWK